MHTRARAHTERERVGKEKIQSSDRALMFGIVIINNGVEGDIIDRDGGEDGGSDISGELRDSSQEFEEEKKGGRGEIGRDSHCWSCSVG